VGVPPPSSQMLQHLADCLLAEGVLCGLCTICPGGEGAPLTIGQGQNEPSQMKQELWESGFRLKSRSVGRACKQSAKDVVAKTSSAWNFPFELNSLSMAKNTGCLKFSIWIEQFEHERAWTCTFHSPASNQHLSWTAILKEKCHSKRHKPQPSLNAAVWMQTEICQKSVHIAERRTMIHFGVGFNQFIFQLSTCDLKLKFVKTFVSGSLHIPTSLGVDPSWPFVVFNVPYKIGIWSFLKTSWMALTVAPEFRWFFEATEPLQFLRIDLFQLFNSAWRLTVNIASTDSLKKSQLPIMLHTLVVAKNLHCVFTTKGLFWPMRICLC